MEGYEKIVEEIYNYSFFGMKLGLQNMIDLCNLFGNPEKCYKVIHIAGTNGKGSTSTMIADTLSLAGYSVGKYTSPHLVKVNERFNFNGMDISDEELVNTYLRVKNIIKDTDIKPTFFELTTIMMFLLSKEKKIDYLVLETGLGGRLDATNVVNSDYVVITNIGLDHVEQLGNTLESIAYEKCEIIKENSIVIIGEDIKELNLAAMRKKCKKIVFVKRNYPISEYNLNYKEFVNEVTIENMNYEIALFGDYQINNFNTAYALLREMNISQEIIKESMKKVFWPCRFQVIKSDDKIIVLDGAHNSHGMKELKNTITKEYKKDEVLVLTSILLDKDIKDIVPLIEEMSDNIILTSLKENKRGSDGEGLAKFFTKEVRIINDTLEALKVAKNSKEKIILICGSFYLLGKVKEVLEVGKEKQ